MKRFFEKNGAGFYLAFRIIIGLTFFLHGWMKLTGVMNGKMALMSLMGLAMIIEVVGGLFLIIGFLVRPVAVIAALQMAYAFIVVHTAGKGTINPLANGGEAALLFFAAFLALAVSGAGRWSVGKK